MFLPFEGGGKFTTFMGLRDKAHTQLLHIYLQKYSITDVITELLNE